MSDNGLYEVLVEAISASISDEDSARLMQGEAAALIQEHYGHGGLVEAAKMSHSEYKTIAERARVIRYYQQLSAGQNLVLGESIARDLIDEFPTLRWTHLRVAKGLSSNPWEALTALRDGQDMTPVEFKRHVARLRRQNGHKPIRMVIDGRAGYRLTIARD
ncbi:MAG: hypothetical protein JXB07_19035 [Anaerolineae bacterium]|nr:hypothetical protein [Anaerolineae bacterium]